MASHLTKALAALAAIVVLTVVGQQSARAQFSYPGGYDPQSGRTWDEDLRYDPVTNPFGFRVTPFYRPAYFGQTVYYGTYPYAAGPASYSYGAYSPSALAGDNTARIRLIVPADAKVWFGQSATRQTGAVRRFESPPLAAGKDYTYDVKATWTENGKEITRTRHVDVRANARVTVDFTRADSGT